MMTYYWIAIFGIIFTSVDSNSDIVPHQEEPLKKLLKRTINHVKSFLVEFEKKIKRSCLLVDEIHRRSLFNISKTKRNDLRTIPTISSYSSSFIRYPESPFIKRALEIRPQNATGINTNLLSSSTTTSYVHNIVRQVDDSLIYPKLLVSGDLPKLKKKPDLNILYGKIEPSLAINEKPFTQAVSLHDKEAIINRGGMLTDTNQGIDANILLGKIETIATTKQQTLARLQLGNVLQKPKSLMQPRPLMYQPQKELGLKLNKTKPVFMSKSFTFDKRSVAASKYPNHLMRQRQIENKINGNSQITKGWKELISHLEIFGDRTYTKKPDTQKSKISTITVKGKRVVRTNQQETKRVNLPNSARIQAVEKDHLPIRTVPQKIIEPTIFKSNYKKEKYHPNLFKFYFQRKHDIITGLQMDYPDIFSMSTSSRPALIITRPASTKKQLIRLTTRSPKLLSSRVIPEPPKDYPNVYFRAASLVKHTDPKKHQSIENANGTKSKRTTAATALTTVRKIKNEKLRKIVAESSYSLSDEEAYLKVNLLDQLLHYNKTLEI